MATETKLNSFKIHQMTHEQFNSAVKNENDLYLVTGTDFKTLAFEETSSGSKKFKSTDPIGNIHAHILFELDSAGLHYGGDFSVHPYDGSECICAFRMLIGGTYVDCNAYLGSDYKVVIDVSNATLSDYSVHGEYIEY